MRICHVVGARPNFMKLAPLHRALSGAADQTIVDTGQHYDANMSSVFFQELEIPPPDHQLGVGSGTHGEQTGKMMQALDPILLGERPDVVVVYGDTNSTLAGALAAAKLHMRTAHVEAGLRSFNRLMPEELNRILTDHVSDLLFAPTDVAIANLKREGLDGDKVHRVGDLMFDSALYYGAKAERESRVLDRVGVERGKYVLTTIHRAENTDSLDTLRVIFSALAVLGNELAVVLPLHPRTRSRIGTDADLRRDMERLRITEPLGYLDMAMLERNAKLIVTDSGGVQKEAFFSGVPCVTLRGETEWTELVELGWNRLVPPLGSDAISEGIRKALEAGPGRPGRPYGTGESGPMIADVLLKAH